MIVVQTLKVILYAYIWSINVIAGIRKNPIDR